MKNRSVIENSLVCDDDRSRFGSNPQEGPNSQSQRPTAVALATSGTGTRSTTLKIHCDFDMREIEGFSMPGAQEWLSLLTVIVFLGGVALLLLGLK